MSDSDDIKDLPPTPRRVAQLFSEGKAPRSPTVGVFIPLTGAVFFLLSFWPMLALREFLALGLEGKLTAAPIVSMTAILMGCFAVLLFLTMASQRIFGPIVFKADNVGFKFSKLDVVKNSAQKFGPSGLLDFALRALAGTVYVVFAVIVVIYIIAPFTLVDVAPRLALYSIFQKLALFFAILVVFAIVFVFLEYLVKHVQFMQQHKMSFEDLKRELKDSEISNEVKQERRRRAQENMKNIGLENVQTADVVMVNPTHFALAIKWNRAAQDVPICVARGADEMAFAIRRLANQYKVPVYKDVPNTRQIFVDLQVGDPILPEHFQAVAAAIAYADELKQHV